MQSGSFPYLPCSHFQPLTSVSYTHLVTNTLKAGKEASVKAEWPDNSLPKAGLKASQTLIGTGSSVTFESSSSQNTEEVSWTLPGSSQESADGESVTVTYDKAGVYDVTVTAKNKSGEDEKTYTGCILVTDRCV